MCGFKGEGMRKQQRLLLGLLAMTLACGGMACGDAGAERDSVIAGSSQEQNNETEFGQESGLSANTETQENGNSNSESGQNGEIENNGTGEDNNMNENANNAGGTMNSNGEREFVLNAFPTIYSDVPDEDIIRVGENYYMASTTMNLCPGVPIMKSTDLVHWDIVNYVYDTFENDDLTNLENGRHMYSHGSWAASLKFDEATGKYYVAFNSNDHGFYVYTTDDIEKGAWKKHFIKKSFHDPALFFEDGKMYVITASGGTCSMQQLELNDENEEVLTVGSMQKLFTSTGWMLWEGAHAYKVEDYYYVFIIASPQDRWMRTEVCYRTKDLLSGNWEEKIVFQNGCGGQGAGLAQGGIVQTQFGDWYAFLFQDRAAVGRVPSVLDVDWQDGWPMIGTYDMKGVFHNAADYASRVYLKENSEVIGVTDNDEFEYDENESLKLVWQWNHNPKNDFWSITDDHTLKLVTDTVTEGIWSAHNSLTQRTIGPKFSSETCVITDNMKAGDYAGIAAVADHCGMVGIMCDENGERHIFQADSEFRTAIENENEIVAEPLTQGQKVYLKLQYDFTKDTVEFLYSLDGEAWTKVGKEKRLGFSTSTTFMGARTWLYHFATKEAGGSAEFEYYHCAK